MKRSNHRRQKTTKFFKDRSGRPHGVGQSRLSEKSQKKTDKSKKQKSYGGRDSARGAAHGLQTFKATVDKNRKGFAFLLFETKKLEDAFIPPREAGKLFHGDRVEVTLNARGKVMNLRVLEHRFRELVGKYIPHPGATKNARGGWVVYERKRAREEIYMPSGAPLASAGDWIRTRLEFHEKGPFPVTAHVTEVYGDILPASADIGMVASEYNLIEAHSAAAESEARSFELDLFEVQKGLRQDLRRVPFITVDGETARDFDDAIYVEHAKTGYTLWVAIADVSYYVTPGSALDREAFSRGTSVYFPERAFHMLPRALSENLCSLRPHEPRLAMVAKMDFDREGRRTKTELIEAVIESRRRATYTEIEREWKEHKKNPHWEFAPHFSLYQKIRKTRSERGSIDFDLPEAKVLVDDQGEPISITKQERLDANRLIEEFMITANEAVTEWIMERKWPFIFRVHDVPAEQSLVQFSKLAATVGVSVSLSNENLNQTLADVVRRLDDHPAQALLNMALLRSMKQAIYSATHGIHFGLASNAYTHFTSPIRRYPDLIVHRLLRRALRGDKKREPQLEQELERIAEHCSYRERIAADADREATKLKQVRAMAKRLGEEFDGKIVGMMESGLFVQIDDPYAEGMILAEALGDDYYEFNEERMIFFGRRKRRTFRIGDTVRIRVVRATIDDRKIDLALVEHHARQNQPR